MKSLPTIVRFLGTDDAPGSSCPHCGATGRYIIRFQVEDGRTLGAMRGCIKLFPVSELAREHEWLTNKQARYAKQKPPWKLNRQDQQALEMIEAAIIGTADAAIAISMSRSARAANIERAKTYRNRR